MLTLVKMESDYNTTVQNWKRLLSKFSLNAIQYLQNLHSVANQNEDITGTANQMESSFYLNCFFPRSNCNSKSIVAVYCAV